jgi:hypothetical protein
MATLITTSVLEPRTEPLSAVVDDDLVMLDPRSGTYLGFDGIGRRIWELLDGRRAIQEVCEVLVTEYDAEPATCQADVVAFLTDLVDADLVVHR